MGTKLQFVVTATTPASPVVVTDKTEFKQGRLVKLSDTQGSRVTYDDLGGLKDGIQKIREMVELPMRHPETFTSIGRFDHLKDCFIVRSKLVKQMHSATQ